MIASDITVSLAKDEELRSIVEGLISLRTSQSWIGPLIQDLVEQGCAVGHAKFALEVGTIDRLVNHHIVDFLSSAALAASMHDKYPGLLNRDQAHYEETLQRFESEPKTTEAAA